MKQIFIIIVGLNVLVSQTTEGEKLWQIKSKNLNQNGKHV